MAEAPDATVGHVGICVADLDRSLAFYVAALGFEATGAFDVGEAFAGLVELPWARLRVAYVSRGAFRFELISWIAPAAVGPAERRPMNRLGLTHLNIVVGDIDAAAARIRAHGGTAIEGTRTASPSGTMMFCTDPDGTRIELWQKP